MLHFYQYWSPQAATAASIFARTTYAGLSAVAMKITKPQVISLMQAVTPYLHRTYTGFARRCLLRGSAYVILSDPPRNCLFWLSVKLREDRRGIVWVYEFSRKTRCSLRMLLFCHRMESANWNRCRRCCPFYYKPSCPALIESLLSPSLYYKTRDDPRIAAQSFVLFLLFDLHLGPIKQALLTMGLNDAAWIVRKYLFV